MIKTRMILLLVFAGSLTGMVGCFRDSRPVGNQAPGGATKQKQMQQPSANAENPIVGPVRYLALGDSTGAGEGARSGGYVARLFRKILAHRPESRLTNRCISGATASDLLNEQMDQIADIDPNLVTVGIGINDIGHGVSLDAFEKNYDEILRRLRENTRAVIVVTNIPDISTAPRIPQVMRSQYQQIIIRYNQKLGEIAARHGVTVFDVYNITRDELPNHPEYFSADGFHPSDQGYELWAETMWPTIAPIVGLDVSAGKQQ